MCNGWSGGQYSLLRALAGVGLLLHCTRLACLAPSLPVSLVLLAAAALSVLLMVGLHDRVAAIALAGVCVLLHGQNQLLGAWLLLHALLPAAPYGSWSSRDREDPSGGWCMPPAVYAAAWVALAIGWVTCGHGWLGWGLAVALIEPLRPWVWAAFLAVQVAHGRDLGLVLLHGFTFDPDWIRPRVAIATETIFYDGHCGLCHGAVRFVLAEDRSGQAFRFAPLQGDTFRARVPEGERAQLPDTIVVDTADGGLLIRSDAVVHILARLGGIWRLLAGIIGLVPASLRDAGYDAVARIRHRLFRAPIDTCPLVPLSLRPRFDA